MKLNTFNLPMPKVWQPLIRKVIMVINVTTVLMIIGLLQVHADGFSQVSLNKRNISLEKVFSSIEKQTDYVFFSKDYDLKKTDVNIHVEDASIETTLNAVLKDFPLTYKIIDKIIVVRRSVDKTTPEKTIEEIINVSIRGKVTNEKGESLPGVSVKVKGTSLGTVTNDNGAYSLSVPDDNVILVFSFIGFISQELAVKGEEQVPMVLSEDLAKLEDVVVVGYGTQQKKDITGSVSFVQGDDLAERKTTQLSTALQGTMPGVMVSRNNNSPGATANIRIRGITTITDAGSNPLIILDGVPIDDINSVNPNDVESISVLKDAASASIYGSRAAAGVILVTTKRAKEGQISLDYTAEYGLEKATEMPEYVNAQRYMELVNELRWNDNGNNDSPYPTYGKDLVDNYFELNSQNPDQYPITDWRGLILNNTAPRKSHILSVSGAGKYIRSRASVIYDKTDALYDDRTYERLTARVNNDIVVNKYLSASVDINYKRTNIEQPNLGDPFYLMGISAPVYAALWSDGRVGAGKDGSNMYAQLKHGGFNKTSHNQVGGKIGLDFTPIEGLKFTSVISPFINLDKGKAFRKKIPYTSFDNPNSVSGYMEGFSETKLTESRDDNYRYTIQFLANYVKQLGEHNLNVMGGYEYYYAFNEELGASRGQYVLNSYPYLNIGPLDFRDNDGSAYENAYRSWFGRAMYNYKGKYLLQANIRYDASSRFASDYRWGSFPSFSAGWIATEESFLKDKLSWLSFLKLRASWGTLGNERIGNYPYQAILNFENSSLFYRGDNVVSAQSAAQWQYAIRDISWETTQSIDIGLDASFLNSRLSLTADYYKKTTKDMLLALEIPDYVGFDNPNQNTGKMHTKGWEMQIGWNDKAGDFRYSTSFNLSDFKSKMGDLGGTEFIGDQIKIEGSEFNEWYGYVSDGLFQTAEEVANNPTLNASVKPGDVRYKDIGGPDGVPDGKISPEYDRVLLGGSLPRFMYGLSANIGYKNWDFSIVLQGVGKQNSRLTADIVQPLRANWGTFPSILDGATWSHYNTPEQNLQMEYPRYSYAAVANNYAMSDFWVINGGYLRVKNINIGYQIPTSITDKLSIKGIRIYGSVTDLWSANKFPNGWDPEKSSMSYPITATYIMGASVKF